MELRQLRYFVAVADELHFGRAAKRLHIAQQSLSAQIQALEKELGTLLFERTTRSVRLTRAGEIFLKEVIEALGHLETGVADVRRLGRGETGQLVVGYHSSTLYSILPLAVRLFRERYPEVEVVLKELMPHILEESILSGEVDAGFSGFLVAPYPNLAHKIINRDPLAVVFPRGHRFEAWDTVPLAALAGEQFVHYSRAHKPEAFHQIIELCESVGFTPHIVQEAVSETAVISLVAAGVGIAITTMGMQEIHPDTVIYRPIVDPSLAVSFVVLWRHNDSSPLVKAFLKTTQEIMDNLP